MQHVGARAAWRWTGTALVALVTACGGPDELLPRIDASTVDAPPIDAGVRDTSWVDAPTPVLEVVDLGVGTGPPTALVLDATHVFWTDGDAIYRKALDGSGARLTVATHALPVGNTGPAIGELAVDATYVYFLANGTQAAIDGTPPQLMRHAKDGGGADEVLITMPGGVGARLTSIAAHRGDTIYMSARQLHGSGVYAVRTSSPTLTAPLPATATAGVDAPGYQGHIMIGGVTLIATGFEIAPTGQPGIMSCDLPACATRNAIASYAEAGGDGLAPPAPGLAADPSDVYWTQGPAGDSIAGSRLIGGGPVTVLTTLPGATLGEVVTDDATAQAWFVVAGPDGAIRKVWKGSQLQTPISVVEHQQSPIGLRLSATHLYWAEGGTGTLWRIGR